MPCNAFLLLFLPLLLILLRLRLRRPLGLRLRLFLLLVLLVLLSCLFRRSASRMIYPHLSVGLVFFLLSASPCHVALLSVNLSLALMLLMLWEGGWEWA